MEGVKIRHAKQENKLNREFQLMMSSTAHQRGVKDLKAAGLNPILSATSAMGAAMGGGSSVAAGGSSGSLMDEATSALGLKTQRNVQRQQAEDLLVTKQDRFTGEARELNYDTDTLYKGNQSDLTRAHTRYVNAQTRGQDYNNVTSALEAEIMAGRWGRGTAYAGKALPFLNTLVGLGTARAISKARGLPPGAGVLRRPDSGGGPSSARGQSSQRERGERSGAPGPKPGIFYSRDIPY